MKQSDLLDSHLLNTFVTIAESDSLTDAAKRLGVTQSAISQSLKLMEDNIGLELVARRTRPVQLTHAGRALKQNADAILGDLRRLAATVRDVADKGVVQCRLGLVSSFSEVFGSQLIAHLSPSIERLNLKSGLTPSLTAAFLNREIDILVSDTPLNELDGLERFPLIRDPMMLAVAADVVPEKGLSIERLIQEQPMIKFSRLTHIGAYSEVVMRRLRILAQVRYETDDTHTLMSFVRDGHGWAILSGLCLAQVSYQLQGVKVFELDKSRHARTLYLVAREGEMGRIPRQVAEAIQSVFRQSVFPVLSTHAPWLEQTQFVEE